MVTPPNGRGEERIMPVFFVPFMFFYIFTVGWMDPSLSFR
jgi:hypothetical protein